MTNRAIVCFRNEARHLAVELERLGEARGAAVEVVPAVCLKLCMLCDLRHVLVLNREVLVAKDKEALLAMADDKLEPE